MKLKFIASTSIAAATLIAVAAPAFSHHPDVSAKAECVNGAFDITVATEAWATDDAARRHNNGISVQLMRNNRVLVAFGGTFTADNGYRFTDTFTSQPAGTYQVRAISTRPWGPNEEFGSELESRTISVTTPDVPCGGEYNQRPTTTVKAPVVVEVVQPTVIGTPTVVERAPVAVAGEQLEAPVTLAFTGVDMWQKLLAGVGLLVAGFGLARLGLVRKGGAA